MIMGDGYIYGNWGLEGGFTGSGEIEIEANMWQLLAIPIQYGYWNVGTSSFIHDGTTTARIKNYVMDQIADLMGAPAENFIQVANTYFGDNDFFYNYIPGITNELSPHNFELVYTDGSRFEVSGFWVKSIHTSNIIISWGE